MDSVDKAVLVGDIHIGWENSNSEEFKQFIEEELYEIDPDVFIINGDFLELWRSSYRVLMLNHSDILSSLKDLHDDGIKVVLVAGNHDWRMLENDRAITEESLRFRENYRFESGNEEFIATHGHEADSINRSRVQNRLLCLTSDEMGDLMSSAWDLVTDTIIWDKVAERNRVLNISDRPVPVKDGPLISRPSLRSLSHVNDPGALALEENRDRYDRTITVLELMYDEIILGSHTHRIEERERYYNPGSWTGSGTGYICVDSGEVSIKSH